MKKTWKLFWGLGFILFAIALVLDATGVLTPIKSVVGEMSVFAILAGLLLLCYAIVQLCKGKVGDIFLPLALIFMLFEKNIATLFNIGDEKGNIINNWLLLLCAVMLWIGFSILFSGSKKKKKKKKHGIEFESCHSGNMGSTVKYIDCDGFKYEMIENNLGSCTIFFENIDKYEGGGVLELDNNLGSMTVNIPEDWKVVARIDNSLGHVTVPNDSNGGPIITVNGDNNLGNITVKRV